MTTVNTSPGKKIRTDPVNSGPDGRWNAQGRRRSRTRISVGFRSTLPRFESDSGVSCRLSAATFGLPEITFPDAQLLASRGGIQDSKVGGVHLCHDFFLLLFSISCGDIDRGKRGRGRCPSPSFATRSDGCTITNCRVRMGAHRNAALSRHDPHTDGDPLTRPGQGVGPLHGRCWVAASPERAASLFSLQIAARLASPTLISPSHSPHTRP